MSRSPERDAAIATELAARVVQAESELRLARAELEFWAAHGWRLKRKPWTRGAYAGKGVQPNRALRGLRRLQLRALSARGWGAADISRTLRITKANAWTGIRAALRAA